MLALQDSYLSGVLVQAVHANSHCRNLQVKDIVRSKENQNVGTRTESI